MARKKLTPKKRIIHYNKQGSLKWYFIGAVIVGLFIAIGNEMAKKSVDKAAAYLAKRTSQK